ncbi:Coronin-7 [Channa argus]|uniref:Coronin n=1 Tax=Channa argus TaxID=215402 RepID=A0A6G1QBY2_CHAAH|nr:Coronin-7 [Channa argus]
MNRFKTSKYKNTAPKIAKKDGWINNVRAGSFSCQGNHIKANSKLVAFNTEQAGGGMLGLSSVTPGPDGQWTVTQISCHSEEEQPSSPELTLSPGQGKLELVHFHPTSSGLLAVSTSKSPTIWDTSRQDAPLAVLEQHSDQLQSLSWKQDGSLLASSCKDKMLRVFDPRAQLTPVQPSCHRTKARVVQNPESACSSLLDSRNGFTPQTKGSVQDCTVPFILCLLHAKSILGVISKVESFNVTLRLQQTTILVALGMAMPSAKSLQNNKDSRILWAKDDLLLTTGFDMMRSREVRLWDSRKLSSSVSSVSLGTSSGAAALPPLLLY